MDVIQTFQINPENGYADLLAGIEEPPARLFVRGRASALQLLESLPGRGFAVVGTRAPQARSELQVRARLRETRKAGLTIVSGLAIGIDACAHETALELGFPTIAVLGSGLSLCYPKENERLRDEILNQGGLIVTEYEDWEEIQPFHFIRRNRIIVGLSKAVWIVEAGVRSGALNTAAWARKSEKRCYATPGYPGDPALAGNEGLLREGQTRAVWTAEDLSESWLELHSSAHRKTKALTPHPIFPGDHPELLRQQIQIFTARDGGASVQDLFDWSVSQGWLPMDFYNALRFGLDAGWVKDQNGIVSA